MRKVLAISATVIVALGLVGASASSATASDSAAESTIRGFLAAHPEISVVDQSVYEMERAIVVGKSGEVLQVLTADGESRDSDSSDDLLAGCSYRNAVFVNYSGWQQSVDGCGIIGLYGSSSWTYSWYTDFTAWNAGPSCIQARGYYVDPSNSNPRWYNSGCGTSGSITVHIGNRSTVAKIRGHAEVAPTIGYVRWK